MKMFDGQGAKGHLLDRVARIKFNAGGNSFPPVFLFACVDNRLWINYNFTASLDSGLAREPVASAPVLGKPELERSEKLISLE